MFALKARVTAYVSVLILVINIVIFHAALNDTIKLCALFATLCAAVAPGIARKSLPCVMVCPLITGCAWLYFAQWADSESKLSLLRLSSPGQEVSLLGTICDTSFSTAGSRKHLVVEVGSFAIPFGSLCRGRLLIDTPAPTAGARGDIVLVRGFVEPPKAAAHPWDYSLQPLLRKSGAAAALTPTRLVVIPMRNQHDVQSAIDTIRSRIIQTRIEAIGASQGNLVSSMVIGNRNVDVEASTSDAFRNLGISHTLAASGFNLSVVVGSTWWLLRPLIRNRAILNVCAAGMMAFYSALAGLSASIVRAAIMCAGLLLATTFERRPDVLAALGGTLVLTAIFDPRCLADVGLQLSYLSTFTLMCKASALVDCFSSLSRRNPLRLLIDVAIPCVLAAVSVFPLQLYYFWQTGLLQLPANILISPLVPIITLEGFVSSAAACIGWTSTSVLLDRLSSFLVSLMMSIVNWLNSYNWSVICTGPPELQHVILFYLFLALALSCSTFRWRATIALSGLLMCTIALLWRPPMPPLTVVRMFRATIAIDSERNAVIVGDGSLYQVRKCLAYFGTRSVSAEKERSGATAYMQWNLLSDNDLLVKIRRSDRQLHLHANKAARISRVAVYD